MATSLETVSRIIVKAEEQGVTELADAYKQVGEFAARSEVAIKDNAKGAERADRAYENWLKRSSPAIRDLKEIERQARAVTNAFNANLLGTGEEALQNLDRDLTRIYQSSKTVQKAAQERERAEVEAAKREQQAADDAARAAEARAAQIEGVNRALTDQIAKLRLTANEYEKYAALQRAGTTGATPEGRAIVQRLDSIQKERAAQQQAAADAREQEQAQAKAAAEAERAAAEAVRAEQAQAAAIEAVNRSLTDQIAKLTLTGNEYEKYAALQRAGTTAATPQGRAIVGQVEHIQQQRQEQAAVAEATREAAAAEQAAAAAAKKHQDAIEGVTKALADELSRLTMSAEEYKTHNALRQAGVTAESAEGRQIAATVAAIERERSAREAGNKARQEAAASEAKMAAEARELLQQINPLAEAEKRLQAQLARNKQLFAADLFGKGAEGMENFAAANQLAEKHVANVTKGIGLSSSQVTNLGYQLNDVVSGLAGGQGFGTVFVQQAGQIVQAIQGPRGITAGLKDAGTWLVGLVTPARAMGAALVGAAVLAIKAWNDWDNSQKEVVRTITGLGRSLGVTKDQFNAMAEAAAKAGDLSVASARDALNTLARTGQIVNPQDLVRAVGLAKDYAAEFTNGDVQAAMREQADLIKSGAAGIQAEMEKRGLINESNRIDVERAVQRNKTAEAYGLFLDSLNGRLVKHEEVAGRIATQWDKLKGAFSDLLNTAGSWLDKVSGPILDKLTSAATSFIETINRNLKAATSQDAGPGPSVGATASAGLSARPRFSDVGEPTHVAPPDREAVRAMQEAIDAAKEYKKAQDDVRESTRAKAAATRESSTADEDVAKTATDGTTALQALQGVLAAKAKASRESSAADAEVAKTAKEGTAAYEDLQNAIAAKAKASRDAAEEDKGASGAIEEGAKAQDRARLAVDAKADAVRRSQAEEKDAASSTQMSAKAQENMRGALEARAAAMREALAREKDASNAAQLSAADQDKVRAAVQARTNSVREASVEDKGLFARGEEGAKVQDKLRAALDAKAAATRAAKNEDNAAAAAMSASANSAQGLVTRLADQKRELSDTLGKFKEGDDPEKMKDIQRRLVLVTETLTKGTQAEKERVAAMLEGKASSDEVKQALEERAAAQKRATDVTNQEIQTANKATEARVPEVARMRELANTRDAILAKPLDKLTDADREALSRLNHELETSVDTQNKRITAEEKSRQEIELGNREITNRTTTQRAATAEDRKRHELIGADVTKQQAANEITAAGARVRLEAVDAMKRQSEEMDRAEKKIALERDLVFASNAERAKRTAELDKENELLRTNGEVNDAVSQALIKQAGKIAEATAKGQEYTQMWGGVRDAGASAMTSLVQDIAKGTKAGEAFRKAIGSLGDQLLGIAGKNIFGGISNSIGTLASGGGTQAALSALTSGVSLGNLAVGGVGFALSYFANRQAEAKAKKQKAAQDYIDKLQKDQEAAIAKQAEEVQKQADLQERLNEYQSRLLEATLHGNDSLSARLALFDADAQKQRADEAAKGNGAIVQLEAALAAERLNILDDFNKEVLARSQSYQDRLFAVTNDTSTLTGQLAAFDREAQRQVTDEWTKGGGAIVELEAALAAERLKIITDFNKQATDDLREFWAGLRKDIQKFIDDLQGGASSPLSPLDRLAASQSAFQRQYAMARGGDRDALTGITGYATSLLDAARDAYASGQQFQDIYGYVLKALQSIQAMAGTAKGDKVKPLAPATPLGAAPAAPAVALGTAANTNTPPMSTPLPAPAALDATSSLVVEIRQLRSEVAAFRVENRDGVAKGTNVVHTDLDELTDAVLTVGTRQVREARLAAQRPRTGTTG